MIVASGGPVTPTAAKAATSTIPIVFTATSDPVKLGLVASLSRPDGNVTGTSAFTVELDAKRMEVLREIVPAARVIGAFVNPTRTDADAQSRAVEDAARALSWEVRILNAESEADIDAAFASVLEQKISALVVGADPFFNNHRVKIVRLAERHALPAIYMNREFVTVGGLASYGTNIGIGYRQAGIYAGQILKGARPADLPVVQPTKYELIINLKTAQGAWPRHSADAARPRRRGDRVKRREFIALLGGAAAWPIGARAQQPADAVIAFLRSDLDRRRALPRGGVSQGLQAGFIEGRNVHHRI